MIKKIKIPIFCSFLLMLFSCFLDKGKASDNQIKIPENFERSNGLILNEVMAYDKKGKGDWIEFYVNGDTSIYLADYQILDQKQSHIEYTLPKITLMPGEFFVLKVADTSFTVEGPSFPYKLGTSDALYLFKNGLVVDHYSWTKDVLIKGASYGLFPDTDGFIVNLFPTPGKENLEYIEDYKENRDSVNSYGTTPDENFITTFHSTSINFIN